MILVRHHEEQRLLTYVVVLIHRLNIPSTENLEDRIREAEAKIGIRPGDGISIKYERKSETLVRLDAMGNKKGKSELLA